MSLFIKVGIFITFLIVYTVWIVAVYKLSYRLQNNLLRGKALLTQEMLLLATVLGFFVFIWILSGYLNIKLIGLFLLAAHLGTIIMAILWALSGSVDIRWGPRAIWAGGEFGMKHPWMMMTTSVISLIAVIAYPVIAGIVYFSHLVPSHRVTVLIFRYTLLALFISSWIAMLPILIGVLSSKNVDKGTRTRFFVAQIGSLVSNALFLALTFWAFGIAGRGYEFSVSGIPFTFSPLLISVVFAFFICTVLIPYGIGTHQAKKWKIHLLERQLGWVRKLLNILDFPIPPSYIPKLTELDSQIKAEYHRFAESDVMVKIGQETKQIEFSSRPRWGYRNLILAYQACRDLDPRFNYVDFLIQLRYKIKDIIFEFKRLGSETDLIEAATVCAKAYHSQKDELSKAIEATKQAKPIVSVGLATITSMIVGSILSEFGEWIWDIFMQAIKP